MKPKLLIWADVSLGDADSLLNAPTDDHLRDDIRKIFNTDKIEVKIKEDILEDLFYYGIKHCIKKGYSDVQLSVIMSILKNIHLINISTSFDNSEQVWSYFTEVLKLHSVHRPPFSLQIFNMEEFQDIFNYVTDTYIRHIKMYKYAFTPEILLDLNIEYPDINEEEQVVVEEETQENEDQVDMDKEDGDEINEDEPKEEESEAVQQVRKLIRAFLMEEVKKMRTTVDDQLKTVRESLNTKLTLPNDESNKTGRNKSAPKSGSAKKSKKK